MANLGFVGLGVMGSEMVNRLLSKGHSVTGYNRTRSKAEWLVKKGVKGGDLPRAGVGAAGFSFLMGTNSKGLGGGVDGAEGMLAGGRPGQIFLVMKPVSPPHNPGISP